MHVLRGLDRHYGQMGFRFFLEHNSKITIGERIPTILSYFVDPTAGGANAKATQTSGLAVSRVSSANNLGPPGVKWLAQSTANSSQILGGEQFDQRIAYHRHRCVFVRRKAGIQRDVVAPPVEAKAAALFQLGMDQGDTRALYALADMYQEGRGVAQDEVKALVLFQQAAEKGDADRGQADA